MSFGKIVEEPIEKRRSAPDMLIINAHEDLAFNVLTDGRNYLASACTTRVIEAGTSIVATSGVCMLGLPEWLRGNVAVIFATLTAIPLLNSIRLPIYQ